MQILKRTSIVRVACVLALTLGILAMSQSPAMAQLNGFNIRGDVGLDAGTQAPPGPYYGLAFYRYGTDTIKDRDGNTIGTGDGSLNLFYFASRWRIANWTANTSERNPLLWRSRPI